MQAINKHTVLKTVRDKGSFTGYIAPNKVNHSHILGGWHLGMEITIIFDDKYFNDYSVIFFGEIQKLEDFLNNFKYYNCNSELGNRIKFWTE